MRKDVGSRSEMPRRTKIITKIGVPRRNFTVYGQRRVTQIAGDPVTVNGSRGDLNVGRQSNSLGFDILGPCQDLSTAHIPGGG